MARPEPVALPARVAEHGFLLSETDAAVSLDQARNDRKRACVLVGSTLLQLPIWGIGHQLNHLPAPLTTNLVPQAFHDLGVFQEYYYANWTFHGSRDVTGIIGTTSNGVMYRR
ncbi:hypothetical protein BP5796_06447 [Coleophoma crateriformis]|uniref:Uncharacterized protein n=1 Tax=Coleophoma crateriformis TaxID=565419 RepID=A0A3D8RNU8_9HELO|nr:hypothetical protein BP5796_06447 [Coleophoma crateriformis]